MVTFVYTSQTTYQLEFAPVGGFGAPVEMFSHEPVRGGACLQNAVGYDHCVVTYTVFTFY